MNLLDSMVIEYVRTKHECARFKEWNVNYEIRQKSALKGVYYF